jgi:hypothetical protein
VDEDRQRKNCLQLGLVKEIVNNPGVDAHLARYTQGSEVEPSPLWAKSGLANHHR